VGEADVHFIEILNSFSQTQGPVCAEKVEKRHLKCRLDPKAPIFLDEVKEMGNCTG
jgi:hypothetical protein